MRELLIEIDFQKKKIAITLVGLMVMISLSCAWFESFISPVPTLTPALVNKGQSVNGNRDTAGAIGLDNNKASELIFDQLSLDEGLSQSSVFAIFQDSVGYLWFGTQDGLNKYDGYEITIYKPTLTGDRALSGNDIRAIYEDKYGHLWIGTNGWGLNRYDRKTDQFTHYQFNPRNQSSLGGNFVNVIFEDTFGNLWIGTDGGLNKYQENGDNFQRYRNVPGDATSLSSNNVLAILEDTHHDLWIGTGGGGLNKFDHEQDEFQRFRNVPGDAYSLSNNTVWSITKDRQGVLWIGTDEGLNQLIESTGRFVRYQYSTHDPNSLSSNQIRAVYADREDVIWIGTNGKGLNRFDRDTGKFIQIQANPRDPNSLSDDFIWEIYEDREGTLWVGTLSGGVNKLDQSSMPFKHYSANDQLSGGLNHNMVWSILEDRFGILWVGTMGGGLNKYDPSAGIWIHYKHDPNDPTSISHDNVRTICEDQSGDLWIGTEGGGLNKFDRENETFIKYQHDPTDPNSLSSDQVLTIHKDRTGNLWIGTLGGGLNRYDTNNGKFNPIIQEGGEPYGLSSNNVRSIYVDREGILWVGTDSGVNKINLKKGVIQYFFTEPNDSNSLSHNIILSIHEDRTGNLWLGTFSGGLNKFDRKTETFSHYFEEDGLANNVVYGILEDGQGFLWLSTNNGLSRFDPSTEQFKNFDAQDGLQSDEFNSGAYYKGNNGELFFGGVNGFNSFFPDKIPQDNLYISPIVLTSFTQGGEEVHPGKNFENLEEITFKWPDDYFEFEYAALSFVKPEQNQYAYKLEGFDKEWNYVGNQRFGRYTNLPGGSFTLRIKGSNNDGMWNEQGISVGVKIVAPFWETWWFRGLIVLVVVVGVVSGYRLRVSSVEARSRALEQQVQDRTFEIERRRQVAEGLRDILVILNSDKSIKESLDYIVCQAARLHEADGAFIYRLNDSHNVTIMAVCPGDKDHVQINESTLINAANLITSQIDQENPLIFSKKLINQLVIYNESTQKPYEVETLLGIPLLIGGRIYGGMVLLFNREQIFTEEEIQLGYTFAEQAALAIANAQLRDRAEQSAVSAERNRLARDLHDSAKQQAFAVSAQLGAALSLFDEDPNKAKEHLAEADRLADKVRLELTDLIQELHPIGLDDHGLVPTLHEYVYEWEKQNGIHADLIVEAERVLSDEIESALFRIVQGALSNVSRHSQAMNVELKLIYESEYVIMTISDDGNGFETEQRHQGLGLRSMRERVELLNGEFSIVSEIGKGTRITVKLFV